MRSHRTTFVCEACGQSFTRRPSEVRRGRTHFCDRACFDSSRNAPSERPCATCGTMFKPDAGNAARGGGKYCRLTCYQGRLGSLEARLLAHRIIDPITGCWIWTGKTDRGGYGQISIDGRQYRVSRIAAHVFLGFDLDSPLFILHGCDRRRCFRPACIRPGTGPDNMRDMVERGRSARGTRSATAKLTEAAVLDIALRIEAGERQAALAREYGVSTALVSNIATRKAWRHLLIPSH
jgi:hypothetical protein